MPQATRLVSDVEMKPSNLTPTECFTTEDHTEVSHRHCTSEGGSTYSGVWECAPATMAIESYPVNEMMTILSGSVTVTSDGAEPETFTTGDSFFVPKGSRFEWKITETLKKFYMITE